jgi:HK97 gp10 family phage protein
MAIRFVKVEGLAETNAALRKLPDDARAEVQQVFDVTAFQVAQKAIAAAPERAPTAKHGVHLKDAFSWKRRKFGAVVGVDPRAFHWKFFEYGTKYMPARPMFRPAMEAMRADHRARLVQALERAKSKMRKTAPQG